MESLILNIAGNATAVAVVVAVVWWRTGEIKRGQEKLWAAFDGHRLDDAVHVREKRIERIEKALNGRLKRIPMEEC